jgi:hypothetical protein
MQLLAFAAIVTALILGIEESRGLFRLIFIIALDSSLSTGVSGG